MREKGDYSGEVWAQSDSRDARCLCLSLLRRKPVTSTDCASGSVITYTPRHRKAWKYVNSSAVNSSAQWVTGKSVSDVGVLQGKTGINPETDLRCLISHVASRLRHIVHLQYFTAACVVQS